MNKLLWKILFSRQGRWQLIIAGAGFCIGLFILLLSVQLYSDFDQLVETQEKQESQTSYLIIHKKITLLNMADKSVSGFGTEEMDTLRLQDFIVSVGGFQTKQFSVYADLTVQFGFGSDVPFESVPDTFIDNKPAEFKWEPEKNFVPVIMSAEYINTYNLTVALAMGYQQVPPELVKQFPFEVKLSGNGKSRKLNARVVGFSNRISALLVPQDFLTWGNAEFADGTKPPSRLILEVKDPGDPRLKQFLARKNYEANPEQMTVQKQGETVKMVVTLTGLVGALFVILSFVIFVLNFQLVLSRAKQEVDILLNIGYTRSSIGQVLAVQLVFILGIVVLIALGGHYIAIEKIHAIFMERGYAFTSDMTRSLLVSACAAGLMMLVNSISLRLSLR